MRTLSAKGGCTAPATISGKLGGSCSAQAWQGAAAVSRARRVAGTAALRATCLAALPVGLLVRVLVMLLRHTLSFHAVACMAIKRRGEVSCWRHVTL